MLCNPRTKASLDIIQLALTLGGTSNLHTQRRLIILSVSVRITWLLRICSVCRDCCPLCEFQSQFLFPTDILPVIEMALTTAAKEGRNQFTLTWLRHQSEDGLSVLDWGLRLFVAVRTQARKAKKRLGPRLNKAITCALGNEVGYKAVLTASLAIHSLWCPGTVRMSERSAWSLWQRYHSQNVRWGA